MKWDAETNAKLFICMMKVYDIKITGSKTAEVAKMLSEMVGEECTPKALTHRLAKLRSQVTETNGTSTTATPQPKVRATSTPGSKKKPKTTTPKPKPTTTPKATTPTNKKRKLPSSSSPSATPSLSDDEEENENGVPFDGGNDDSDDDGDLVTPTRGTKRVRRLRKGVRKSYVETGDEDEEGERGGGRRKIKNEPHEAGGTEGLLAQNYDFAPETQGRYGFGEGVGVYGLGGYASSHTGAYAPDPTFRIKPEPETDADANADALGLTAEEVMGQRQGMPMPYPTYDPALYGPAV